MKIILHAGMHKTGTSSIQQFCTLNRGFLADQGICWPSEKTPRHAGQHSWLANVMTEKKCHLARAYVDRAIAEAEAMNARTLLLSGEDFCMMRPSKYGTFQTLFGDFDIKVILYFRNVFDYILSALSERAKNGQLIFPKDEPLRQFKTSLDYSGIIRRWEATVGKENVIVRSYDMLKKNLVSHFFQELGISAEELNSLDTELRRNLSVSFPTIAMLFFADATKDKALYNAWLQAGGNAQQGSNILTTAQIDLVSVIFKNFRGRYGHQKLKDMRQRLLKKPTANTSPEAIKDQIKHARDILNQMLELEF